VEYGEGDILQLIITNNYDLKDPQHYRIMKIIREKNFYLLRNEQSMDTTMWAKENIDVFFRRISSTRGV
jgi:hypothetical protein